MTFKRFQDEAKKLHVLKKRSYSDTCKLELEIFIFYIQCSNFNPFPDGTERD